jgi:hypothetical protein
MTPAMLLDLRQVRLQELELVALPIDKLAWIYSNANRDPGEQGKRPPAPPMELDVFRTYYTRRNSVLESKGPKQGVREWDYTLLGAKASKSEFVSNFGGKSHEVFIPHKEN